MSGKSAVVVITPELVEKVLNLVSLGSAPRDLLDASLKQLSRTLDRPGSAIFASEALLKTYQEADGEISRSDMMLGALHAICLLVGSSDQTMRDLLSNMLEITRTEQKNAANEKPLSDVNRGEVF
jgi:hypothetical protein